MRILPLLLLLAAGPASAEDSPLAGNWKLISFQVIYDNDPPQEQYGARPQ